MSAKTQAPVRIPPVYRDTAIRLIADLASVAGDNPAAFDAIDRHMADLGPDDRLAVAVAALVVTFTECITEPTTSTNDPVPVEWPGLNEGEAP